MKGLVGILNVHEYVLLSDAKKVKQIVFLLMLESSRRLN